MTREPGFLIALATLIVAALGIALPDKSSLSKRSRMILVGISVALAAVLLWLNAQFSVSNGGLSFFEWSFCRVGAVRGSECDKTNAPKPGAEAGLDNMAGDTANVTEATDPPTVNISTPPVTVPPTPTPTPTPPPSFTGRWSGAMLCNGERFKFTLDLTSHGKEQREDELIRIAADFSYYVINPSVQHVRGNMRGSLDDITGTFELRLLGFELDQVYPMADLRGTLDSRGGTGTGYAYLGEKRCGRINLAKGDTPPEV